MKNYLLFWLLLTLLSPVAHAQIKVIADFETPATTPATFTGDQAKAAANPDTAGNRSATAGYYKKTAGNFRAIGLNFGQKISIGNYNTLTFKVRSSTQGRLFVKVINAGVTILESWAPAYEFRPLANRWTEGKLDLSALVNKEFDRLEINASVDAEAEADVYVDDFSLSNPAVVGGRPVATARATATQIKLGEPITFDASRSFDLDGTIASYAWDFKDGRTGTGAIVTHQYAADGIYDVALTVTDNEGKASQKQITVYVLPTNGQISAIRLMTTQPKTHEKVEGAFVLAGKYANVYDPGEVSVDALVTLPDQKQLIVPCFYYIKGAYLNGSWRPDSTVQYWALRFSSPLPGAHKVTLRLTDKAGTTTSAENSLTLIQGTERGYIVPDAQNRQYYRHTTGEPYYPLGINVGWNTIENYTQIMGNLSAGGANLMRYWQVPFNRQALEWRNDGYTYGLGRYSAAAAAYNDSLFTLGEQKNLNLQVVLFQHGMFSENVNSNWSDNPYNRANGGMLTRAEEYFYNAEAKALTKKLLRYVVARWGYSNQIFAWELFNEVQFTGIHNSQTANWRTGVINWHNEMGQYIKSIDPFKHIVATSADENQLPELDKQVGLDNVQYHLYSTDLVNQQNSRDLRFRQSLTRTSVFCGEYGLDVNTAATPFDIQRTIIWTGIMNQVPHLMWTWEDYVKPEWGNLFKYPAAFLQGKDLVKEGTLQDLTATAKVGATNLKTTGFSSPKNAYLLVYDDANRDNLSGATLAVTGLPAGNYQATYTNTVSGTSTTAENVAVGQPGSVITLPTFSKSLAIQLTYDSALVTAVEPDPQVNFTVFPNPTTNSVTVEFTTANDTKATWSLLTMAGRTVAGKELIVRPNQPNTLQLSLAAQGLPTGQYILKMQLGDRVASRKIVLSR